MFKHLFNYIKAIRAHHWAKNLLIFLPAILSHKIENPKVLSLCILAFTVFSFTASIGYLVNDILDLKTDKLNSYKSKRPLASGELSKKSYYFLIIILTLLVFFLSTYLPKNYFYLITIYLSCSLLYSLFLKSVLLLDVVMLASFYAFRVFAGATATNIVISQWFLSFCLFFFLSLALAKRVSELIKSENIESNNRAYRTSDLNLLTQLGISTGLISTLVLAFYVQSESVKELYSYPSILWALSLILIYWISRFWILVTRGQVEQDPVVFTLKDKVSYIVCILLIFVIYIAR